MNTLKCTKMVNNIVDGHAIQREQASDSPKSLIFLNPNINISSVFVAKGATDIAEDCRYPSARAL